MDELGETWADGPAGQGGARRQGFPVDPHRLKRALLGGKRWLIGAGIIGAIIGFLYVKLVMISYYETVVVLKYEGDVSISDQRPSAHAIVPAADALVHQSVLREIRDELGFDTTLTDLAAWIDYETDYRAGILRFAVSGETGDEAAEYARVVTNVFMAYHRDRQSRRIEAEIARMDKRIDAAENDAEQALRRYNTFREKHGIADLPTERQAMLESAAQLRADSELAVPEIRALEAQVASLETLLASTPKTSVVGGGVSPERATYEQLRQELVSAQASLSPDHPRVQALQQQVTQLRAQLRSGGGSTSSGGGLVGINATYESVAGQLREAKSELAALRERQKGLSGMAEKAQRRVADFSGLEGEASALLAAVKVNDDLRNDLRSTKSVLEDALRDPPSGFVVLDPGGVPEFPVANKMKPVVFLAIPMLSVIVVLLFVLRREFRGLRLETPTEIAFWGKGPVLTSTAWPSDPDGLGDLVAGLDDYVPLAKGRFLLVGCSPDESQLARALTDRMNRDWSPANEPAVSPSVATRPPAQRGPLQTPPPSGPYPVGPSGSSNSSVALVRLPPAPETEALRVVNPAGELQLDAWNGPLEGQSLRRAARLADRVIVLVRSGAVSVLELNGVQRRFGRDQGVGFIVVGLSDELLTLPDRVGDVAAFWRG
ncbi:MAG: hypothetical protein HKN97_13980 [Myxococcales bacterium]|nr:hypothetical protein [Myxococcales bacterium]NNK09311.1 hypothetical protein [Myxococcales bacterium]